MDAAITGEQQRIADAVSQFLSAQFPLASSASKAAALNQVAAQFGSEQSLQTAAAEPRRQAPVTLVLGVFRSWFTAARPISVDQYLLAVRRVLGLLDTRYDAMVDIYFADDAIPFRANMIYFDGGGRAGVPDTRESSVLFSIIAKIATSVHLIRGTIPVLIRRDPSTKDRSVKGEGELYEDWQSSGNITDERIRSHTEKMIHDLRTHHQTRNVQRIMYSGIEMKDLLESGPYVPNHSYANDKTALQTFIGNAAAAGREASTVLGMEKMLPLTPVAAIEAQLCSNCVERPATVRGKFTNRPFCSRECMIGASHV